MNINIFNRAILFWWWMLPILAASPSCYSQHSAVNNNKGKRVEYDLYIDHLLVNYTGKQRKGLAINGGIPGPVLQFTEGDTAIIRVHNKLDGETSIHWHGLLLPNEQDGVPYLTTAPIKGKTTHTFTFPLIQSGTYWYHSHTMLQEQSGIYGSIVIHPKNWDGRKEHVLMLSDWTDENPHEVLRNLKRGLDWYAVKKNSVQSYAESIGKGYFKDRLKTEWGRMPAMDISDVYYNRFFISGKSQDVWADAKPGQTVRLRIINGSASSYFWLNYAGGKMKIVEADGQPVQPVEVDKILIAIAETYDVEVKIPEDGMAYEFRATAQDISGYASLFLGDGMKMNAADLPKFDYFGMMREMNDMGNMKGSDMGGMKMDDMKGMKMDDMKGMDTMKDMKKDSAKMEDMPGMKMDMSGIKMDSMNMSDSPMMNMPMDTTVKDMNMNDMGMSGMKMDSVQMNKTDALMMNMPDMDMGNMQMDSDGEVTLSYDMLRASQPTTLDESRPLREIRLNLSGNMIRYVWSFDDRTLSQSDKILIRKGENVRMTLVNNTMMRHPLHLHGHFFRFVNAQGEYSPMKHTFDIAPMQTVTIEFYANEEKDWFFHCHILYHMMAGMARVISYENSPPNTQLMPMQQKMVFKEDRKNYLWGVTKIATDAVFGNVNLSGNKGVLSSTYRISYKDQYEFQPDYQHFLDKRQFLSAFIGADIRNTIQVTENSKLVDRNVGVAGIRYLLPMFLLSELRIDHRGELRFQLTRNDIPITRSLRLGLSANTDKEFNIDFDHNIGKRFYIHASYDSDYKYGVGLTILW